MVETPHWAGAIDEAGLDNGFAGQAGLSGTVSGGIGCYLKCYWEVQAVDGSFVLK